MTEWLQNDDIIYDIQIYWWKKLTQIISKWINYNIISLGSYFKKHQWKLTSKKYRNDNESIYNSKN